MGHALPLPVLAFPLFDSTPVHKGTGGGGTLTTRIHTKYLFKAHRHLQATSAQPAPRRAHLRGGPRTLRAKSGWAPNVDVVRCQLDYRPHWRQGWTVEAQAWIIEAQGWSLPRSLVNPQQVMDTPSSQSKIRVFSDVTQPLENLSAAVKLPIKKRFLGNPTLGTNLGQRILAMPTWCIPSGRLIIDPPRTPLWRGSRRLVRRALGQRSRTTIISVL